MSKITVFILVCWIFWIDFGLCEVSKVPYCEGGVCRCFDGMKIKQIKKPESNGCSIPDFLQKFMFNFDILNPILKQLWDGKVIKIFV